MLELSTLHFFKTNVSDIKLYLVINYMQISQFKTTFNNFSRFVYICMNTKYNKEIELLNYIFG